MNWDIGAFGLKKGSMAGRARREEGMSSQPGCGMGRNATVNASGRAKGHRKALGTGSPGSPRKAGRDVRPLEVSHCGVCLKPLPPGAGAKFCSSRHRLMAFWLREIVKALRGGTAEGLRDEIRRIGESA